MNMKNIITKIAIFIIVLINTQCIPTNVNPVASFDKLKYFTVYNASMTDSSQYLCEYNSDSTIISKLLFQDNSFLTFTIVNNSELNLSYSSDDIITNPYVNYKVYVSSQRLVDSIKILSANSFYYIPVDSIVYRFNRNSTQLLTIFEKSSPYFIKDINTFDFEFTGNNYTSFKMTWNKVNFPSTLSELISDNVVINHNSMEFNKFAHYQQPILGSGFALNGYITTDFIFYLLQLNDYKVANENRNLVSKYESTERGFVTNITYSFNANNQLNQMNISNIDGSSTLNKIRYTYY
jgi:hypothetical protein